MRLRGFRIVDVAKRLFKEVGEDDLSGLAAELAYRFFLTLFPFFIFLAAMGGFIAAPLGIDNPTDRVMRELGDNLPPDAASVIRASSRKSSSRRTGRCSRSASSARSGAPRARSARS